MPRTKDWYASQAIENGQIAIARVERSRELHPNSGAEEVQTLGYGRFGIEMAKWSWKRKRFELFESRLRVDELSHDLVAG